MYKLLSRHFYFCLYECSCWLTCNYFNHLSNWETFPKGVHHFMFSVVVYEGSNFSTSSWSESEVAQLCPTLWDPMDWSLPGSSIHGIFQARILEWVIISFSRRSSCPRDWTLHCRQMLYFLSHQGSSNYLICVTDFDSSQPNECEVVSFCSSYLHFPDS